MGWQDGVTFDLENQERAAERGVESSVPASNILRFFARRPNAEI